MNNFEKIKAMDIDVSNCPHKRDDDCMEVPICNEYGDLMGYQSCEAQTLCPYRSQKKIERLEQERDELLEEIKQLHNGRRTEELYTLFGKPIKYWEELEQENKELRQQYNCYACDTCQGKEDYRNMKRHCENAIKIVHSYRSALEEIRECINTYLVVDGDFINSETYLRITDKINEVLGNEIQLAIKSISK